MQKQNRSSSLVWRPLILAMALFALAIPSAARAVTRQVPSQYATLAQALNAAQSGDVIVLAPGVHAAVGLQVEFGVTLQGNGAGAKDTVLDAGGQDRILMIESVTDTVRISNLTFRNGSAMGATNQDRSGGAILVNRAVARIENCNFTGNLAEANGGAIRSVASALFVEGCTFTDNRAPGAGGGACEASFGGKIEIRDSLFLNNSSRWGGALSIREGVQGLVDNSRLVGNTATKPLGFGGAVFADQGSLMGIVGSVMSGNSAQHGGAVACFNGAQVNLARDTICDNTAVVAGGGLLLLDASPYVSDTIIAFNNGTAISLYGTSTLVINCTNIYGNTGGDWTSQLLAISDPNRNSSVDPNFCSRDPLSSDGLHLTQGATLLSPANGCVTPGAYTEPCATTVATSSPPPALVALAPTASPNPFNPRTAISFALGVSQPVRVEVHGLRGELVRVLADETLQAGEHTVIWEGKDAQGRTVASGIYVVIVRGGQETKTLKVTLLK